MQGLLGPTSFQEEEGKSSLPCKKEFKMLIIYTIWNIEDILSHFLFQQMFFTWASLPLLVRALSDRVHLLWGLSESPSECRWCLEKIPLAVALADRYNLILASPRKKTPTPLPSITGLSILPPLCALHSRLPPLCPLIYALPLTLSLFGFKPQRLVFCSAFLSVSDPLCSILTLSLPHSCCPQWDWLRIWGPVPQLPVTLSLSLEKTGPRLSKVCVKGGGGLDVTPHTAVGPRWSAALAIQLHQQHPLPLSVLHTNQEGFPWWDSFQFTSELLTGDKTVYWRFCCK